MSVSPSKSAPYNLQSVPCQLNARPGSLIRVEDLVRGATTRDNLAVTRKRRSPYLRHRLASFLTLVHLSCPCLALLWPKLLAGHNLKLSHFLFGLDHHWLLSLFSQSLAISRPLSPLLWEALVLVWRVVGSTELVQASLTLEGVEALLYLFTPKSQRPLKVPLRMHRKYTAWPLPPSSSLAPKSWQGGGRPSPASPRARGRRRKRCGRREEKGFSASATAGDATLGAGEVCSSRGGDPTVDGVEAQSRARERPAVQRLSELIVRRETKPTGSSSSSSCQQGS